MSNISVLDKDCCGCFACEQVCPKKCIRFEADAEGFMYPQVDADNCIDCRLCVKSCPVLSYKNEQNTSQVFAAKANDPELLKKSASGGIFAVLARYVLRRGGVVFGCAYNEKLSAVHIKIDSEDELYRLQSSKYMQSNLDGVYSEVKECLDSGKEVLFSGTGCQVAGLKSFLKNTYDNLLTADVLCHGVSSPLLFSKYIEHLGKKYGGDITGFNFRSKDKHGWDLYFQAKTQNKTKTFYGMFDPYGSAFFRGKNYRESCYSCKFACSDRKSDFTLGDFWGIETADLDFYDKKGVSLVLINSEKAAAVKNELASEITWKKESFEDAVKQNANLVRPTARPDCRDTIYDGMNGDFDAYVKTKLSPGPTMKKRIKLLVPIKLKARIKSILK